MSDTPRVNTVLGNAVGPLAAASSQDEFTAALKATLRSLVDEAKKLERENDGLREGVTIAVRELSTVENDWTESEYVDLCLKVAADLQADLDTANK